MIDNMMIVSPPEEKPDETGQTDSRANLLDLSELEIDYLQTNALSDDSLSMDYLKDITFDADLFEDFLASDGLRGMSEEKEGVRLTGTIFGFDKETQIYTILTEDQVRVTRGVNNIADIIVPKLQNTLINIIDSGKSNIIIINNEGGSRIIVDQKN
jgi:hypothetical protein